MPPSVQLRGPGSQHPSQAPGGLMAPSAGARWGGSEGTKVLCLLHPTSFLQVPTEDFRALTCLNSIHLQLGNPNSLSVPHREVPCRSLVTFKIPGLLSKQETPNTIDVVPSTTVTWTHFCPHLTGEQTAQGGSSALEHPPLLALGGLPQPSEHGPAGLHGSCPWEDPCSTGRADPSQPRWPAEGQLDPP